VVILVDGRLAAWVGRGDRQVLAWLPEDEPRRQHTARAIAGELNRLATESPRQGLLVAGVNGLPVGDHPLAPYLDEVGFRRGALGMARSRRKG
jgi:ATP-dependent Lhr-like helicase